MGNPLRDRRTPTELAQSGQLVEISEKLSEFKRLAAAIGGDLDRLDPAKLPHGWASAGVRGRLEFGFADAQRQLAAVEGRVDVTVDAVCQRCLEPMRLPLSVEPRLLFGDGNAGDGSGYEAWETEEDRIRPLDLVDELLVMALPFAARHDDADCRSAGEREAAGGTTRPFANLRSQMDREC